MENNPKKSKALIITIILIIILILVGFFLFKNRDVSSTSSGLISRIFSPLLPSDNTKKSMAQAGEDLTKGDRVYVASSDSDGNPIVMKVDESGSSYGKVLGTANQNIGNGDFGEIIIDTSGGSNGFLNSFSIFIDDLFGNGDITIPDGDITIPDNNLCTNGAIDYPLCTKDETSCLNGATNYPACTIDMVCTNGAIDYPLCTKDETSCLNGATNYPLCTGDDTTKECLNGATNYPACTVGPDGCLNGATNPPLCTIETGEEGMPELTAGVIKPTSTTIDTPTTISSIITNNGDASTVVSFTSLFTIKKDSEITSEEELDTETPISKSSFKNLLVKIINIIPWVSSASAAVSVNNNINPTPNPVPVPIPGTFNFTTSIPILEAQTGNLATISYTFTSTGTYSIRACADKNSVANQGIIEESNEENNCGPWTRLTVTGSLPPPGEDFECNDTVDNDIDGLTDNYDPNCHIDGELSKDYVPTHNNESSSPSSLIYQCNDDIDNDKDGLVDNFDSGCHTNGDLKKEYIPTHDDESSTATNESEINKCLLIEQNPLEFTDEEKARLAVLLRKFYLISSTLKTTDDIVTIYNEIDQQKNFIGQIDTLNKQCYLETKDSSGFNDFCLRNKELCNTNYEEEFNSKRNYNYSSPGTIKHGNPWYTKANDGKMPYSKDGDSGYLDYNWLEPSNDLSNTWGPDKKQWGGEACKVVSGYYYGTGTYPSGTKYNCDTLNNFPEYGLCAKMSTDITNGGGGPDENRLNEGCKWKDGVYLEDTERILNIW